MSKVPITVMVNERSYEVEVNREELAERLQYSNRIAKIMGMRPGEPADLTKTSSDPISHERFSTLSIVLEALKKENS